MNSFMIRADISDERRKELMEQAREIPIVLTTEEGKQCCCIISPWLGGGLCIEPDGGYEILKVIIDQETVQVREIDVRNGIITLNYKNPFIVRTKGADLRSLERKRETEQLWEQFKGK